VLPSNDDEDALVAVFGALLRFVAVEGDLPGGVLISTQPLAPRFPAGLAFLGVLMLELLRSPPLPLLPPLSPLGFSCFRFFALAGDGEVAVEGAFPCFVFEAGLATRTAAVASEAAWDTTRLTSLERSENSLLILATGVGGKEVGGG